MFVRLLHGLQGCRSQPFFKTLLVAMIDELLAVWLSESLTVMHYISTTPSSLAHKPFRSLLVSVVEKCSFPASFMLNLRVQPHSRTPSGWGSPHSLCGVLKCATPKKQQANKTALVRQRKFPQMLKKTTREYSSACIHIIFQLLKGKKKYMA